MERATVIITISFMLFLSFPFKVSSFNTLKQGETLNSSVQLVSAKKIFTLGFYSPKNTNTNYLGIWYTKDSDSPVWLANRNKPIHGGSAALTVDSSGKLMIIHDGGDPIELYAASTGTNITATLLDTGNFVVKEVMISSNGSSSSGRILWESFDYPTDTLLPGMKLGISHKTGRNWTLTSWFSYSNPASGAFTLEWDWIRRRVVVRRRGVVYWTSGDLMFSYQFGNLKVYKFDYIVPHPDPANLNYIFRNVSNQDEEFLVYSLFSDGFTEERRKTVSGWRLHPQGNIFDFDRVSVAMVELCYGYNTRGSETYVGCELWQQPKCRNNHQNFTLRYGYFPFYTEFYDNNSALDASDCRANCWNDCECVGFKAEDTGCLYWRGRNETLLQDDLSRSQELTVLVSRPPKKKNYKIIISLPVTGFLLSILVLLYFIVRKLKQVKRRKKKELQELMTLEDLTETSEFESNGGPGYDLKQFTYASILASTNNLSMDNKLGEGGFGPVYKGKMPQGHEIAVKLLSQRSGQGLLEFKTELVLMSKLQHRNLVKVLGFCIHGNEKIIIYDYLPNKSLDFFLFDATKKEQLDWERRFNIIEGIAQGLLYLHKYSRILIVHRDLKASNILLDENMNPKISDFGLARIFKEDVTEANTTKRVGTRGYMAPEYVTQGTFSVKSDIYSFGVVTLEIVSGRRNNSFHNMDGPLSLVEYAWELWKQCSEVELVDPALKSSCTNAKEQLRSCIQVGLLCVQNGANARPTTEDVVSMLRKEAKALPIPRKPAFLVKDDVFQKVRKPTSLKFSLNQVTLSAMEGR